MSNQILPLAGGRGGGKRELQNSKSAVLGEGVKCKKPSLHCALPEV